MPTVTNYQVIKASREDIALLILSRDADINLGVHPLLSPFGYAVLQENESLMKGLSKYDAETDVLLDNLYQATAQLTESCQCLRRCWAAQRYNEQVTIIRSHPRTWQEQKGI